MTEEKKTEKLESELPEICKFCGYGVVVRSRLSSLREDLDEKEKLAEEYLARLQWLQAEFENFRKRSLKEREELVERAAEGLSIKLLDFLDNFERALENARRSKGGEDPLVMGLEMIYEQFLNVLKKEGLGQIKAIGEVFDPFKHEAVGHVRSPDHEDGTIVEEVQKGYTFKSRVIRPSKVVVVKNPNKRL